MICYLLHWNNFEFIMSSIRNLYVLSVTAAIIAAFTSFFPNEVKAMLFLLVIVMDSSVNKSTIKSKPLQLLLIFYFISFVYVFILGRGHFSEIRNILLPYPMMLMCFWIAPGLMKLNVKEAKFIWYVFLFCLVENLIATAFIAQVDPWAVRYIFKGIEGEADEMMSMSYSRLGMMSYAASHMLSLVCSLLVVVAIVVKKVWIKILVLATALLAVYVMYLTTITTTLLLGILCMAAVAVLYFTKGSMRWFIVLFSFIFLLLWTSGGLTSLLFSSSQGENYELSAKLNDVAESIQSGKVQGQVASRENENVKTWNAILRNPIFGGADGPDDAGQHAMVFDYWAYYGVFCLLLFWGWWKEVKRMKRRLNNKMWNAYLICLLPIFLVCFIKGPIFLPNYILATTIILRVGFLAIETEKPQIRIVEKKYEDKKNYYQFR